MNIKLSAALLILVFVTSCNKDEVINTDDETSKIWIQSESDFAPEARITQIAISGDGTTVAITDWDPNSISGKVKVYRKTGSSWQQIGESLTGEFNQDRFGVAISLNSDGNILAVGAPSFPFNFNSEGKVFVYEFTEENWNIIGEITGPQQSNLGVEIELNGDGSRIAILSAPQGSNDQINIYEQTASNWLSIIDGFEFAVIKEPWWSLALNDAGNRLFIGVSSDGANNGTGYVDAYSLNGSELVSIGETIVGENQFDSFGNIGINADGTAVAVGGYAYPNGDNLGIVKVYKDNIGWQQIGSTLYGVELGDQFGQKVALNREANRLIVGAGVSRSSDGLSSFIQIFDFIEGDWRETLTIPRDGIEVIKLDVKLSDDGNTIVCLFGNTLEIWNYE